MYEVAHARSQRLRIPVVTWLYWIGVHIPALLLALLLTAYLDQAPLTSDGSFLIGLIMATDLIKHW